MSPVRIGAEKASNDHAGGGAGGVKFADGVAGLSIGCGGDRAGVQHHNVSSFGGLRRRAAAVEELALDGGAVGLGGPAAELFDEEGGHRE